MGSHFVTIRDGDSIIADCAAATIVNTENNWRGTVSVAVDCKLKSGSKYIIEIDGLKTGRMIVGKAQMSSSSNKKTFEIAGDGPLREMDDS